MLIPLGQTVRLWRLHHGLTQQQLAAAARIPRPNLCAIERGQREASLSTLRTLALALQTSPGVLVDGIPPETVSSAPLSRATLERIADGVVSGRPVSHPVERQLVALLRRLTRSQAASSTSKHHGRPDGHRATERAWLTLEAAYSPQVIRSLLERTARRYLPNASSTD